MMTIIMISRSNFCALIFTKRRVFHSSFYDDCKDDLYFESESKLSMFLSILSSSSFVSFVALYCCWSDDRKGFEKKFLLYFFPSSALFANFNITLFIDNNA